MDFLNTILNWVTNIFTWWVVIMPWEQGIRVRLGKHIKKLNPGMFFKIPIIDSVFLQTIRKRMINVPIQTLTTKDGKTITLMISIGYSINDVLTLYNTLYHPETTIQCIIMNKISEYVSNNNTEDCTPNKLCGIITSVNELNQYGISNLELNLLNYAIVRTYRLIQDTSSMYSEQLRMDIHKLDK